ncbi:MAG: hypothetical protein WBV94_29570 [Blastocatellia bacterium]
MRERLLTKSIELLKVVAFLSILFPLPQIYLAQAVGDLIGLVIGKGDVSGTCTAIAFFALWMATPVLLEEDRPRRFSRSGKITGLGLPGDGVKKSMASNEIFQAHVDEASPERKLAAFKRASAIIASLIIIAACLGGYFGYKSEQEKHQRLRGQIAKFQQENDTLKKFATSSGYGLVLLEDDCNMSSSSFGRLKASVVGLKDKINKLDDLDEFSSEMDVLTAKAAVEDAAHDLDIRAQDFEERFDGLNRKIARLGKELSQSYSVNPTPEPAPDKKEQTVYVTNTGKKYHRDGCQYLSRSQIPIKKSEAINKGYTACSRCSP